MATHQIGKTRTFLAGEDLSSAQYHFVTLESDGFVDIATDGATCIGVVLNTPASGEAATVALDGRVLVEAGGNIAVGAAVASNATGEAITAATADVIMGYAMEAGVDGQIIAIELIQGGNAAA